MTQLNEELKVKDMSELVSIKIEDHVADVRLNRPEKYNALSPELIEAIIDAGEKLSAMPEVRCIVLSGEGKGFCSGMDFNSFEKIKDDAAYDLMTRDYGISNIYQYIAWVWRDCPVPVIAALHGTVFGGGFQLCLGADIRIAHPQSKLSIMEIKWGLVPDMSGTILMPQLVAEDLIRELTYTGRIFSGEQAKEYGFVTHLADEPHTKAMELAFEIAKNNPDAIRVSKKIFNNVSDNRAEELMLAESDAQKTVASGKNHTEAVKANIEKRSPKFENSSL
jgi:enoyl-CoA hydratase/carnithine racemase